MAELNGHQPLCILDTRTTRSLAPSSEYPAAGRCSWPPEIAFVPEFHYPLSLMPDISSGSAVEFKNSEHFHLSSLVISSASGKIVALVGLLIDPSTWRVSFQTAISNTAILRTYSSAIFLWTDIVAPPTSCYILFLVSTCYIIVILF